MRSALGASTDGSGSAFERLLIDAFADARASIDASPDLFTRVTRSIDDARARRRFRLRLAAGIVGFVVVNAAWALALSNYDQRRFTMPWWVIELLTNVVLVALAIGLGPFIKRFGRAYAADVFRANPRTGKSYLVLTDVAYYLIFTSFVLFTVSFVEHADWARSTGDQLKDEVARVGGILLIMGVLHAANVVALPIIGGLLSNNRRLEDAVARPDASAGSSPRSATTAASTSGATPSRVEAAPSVVASMPPLGPGTWLLRIEAAPDPIPAPDPAPASPTTSDAGQAPTTPTASTEDG